MKDEKRRMDVLHVSERGMFPQLLQIVPWIAPDLILRKGVADIADAVEGDPVRYRALGYRAWNRSV